MGLLERYRTIIGNMVKRNSIVSVKRLTFGSLKYMYDLQKSGQLEKESQKVLAAKIQSEIQGSGRKSSEAGRGSAALLSLWKL